jgi:hypothetical protein
MSLALCVECQAAAVRMFLSFFRLGILALEIGERYIQRLVPEANSLLIDATPANYRLADHPPTGFGLSSQGYSFGSAHHPFTSAWCRRKVSKVRAALAPRTGVLFSRTRLRRNHACYAIVDTQLTVNFTRMFDQIVRQINESNLRFTGVLRIVITERIDYQIGDPAVVLRFNRGCAIGKGLLDVLDYGPFVFELCSWRILVAR